MPLVSVIVPVYKVEDYLAHCLDSLCVQSLHEIEVIVVDDASPDRCGMICEEYAAKDKRFKVIHHLKNKGLSVARNTGIQNASSDYIMFVDSDDWVHEDFCRAPYECAVRYQADVVLFNFKRIKTSNSFNVIGSKSADFSSDGYRSHLEAMDLIHGAVGQAAWNKLYKKELFYNCLYPEGFLCEDWGTTYKLILKAKSIYYLDQSLYYYQALRPGSIMSSKNKKSLYDWIELTLQQYRDLLKWGYPDEKLEAFLVKNGILYCMQKKRDSSVSYYVYFAKTINSCVKVPAKFSWKMKMLFYLLKYCPELFEFVCVSFGKKIC